ncbi:tetratricopeptide repeat protein, partial [Coleofasciculus sp.]|uniref:tetratricopeptide repeat protein n=1 Tax=Coleofasciculus sp. TaxID=3100458 RepID=UPI003A16217B
MSKIPVQIGVALATLMTGGIASATVQTPIEPLKFDRTPTTMPIAQAQLLDQLWQQVSQLRGVGKYREAIAILDRIVQIQPEAFLAWYWRGEIFSSWGQYESAIASYDEAIRLQPSYLLAQYKKGQALYELQRYQAAVTTWQQTLTLNAESEYEQTLISTVIPKQIAQVLSYELREYNQALSIYDQLLQTNEQMASVWVERAAALYKLERYQDAVASCDKALELEPRNALAWKRRGLALYQLERYQQAIASLERAAS